MNDREILQLSGHLNPVTYAELYDYYDKFPKQAIKRKVSKMEIEGLIVFTCYEKAGFYITPEGLKEYETV
jgi:hypothetical protein